MEETIDNAENIQNINIEKEMSASYIDYSMSVIVGRALPDARDGLKPVHRRVLFAMKELTNYHNKPFKKSARVVGDVIGKYHPHGDTAVYDTIVRMAQDWSMRYPLVDGQGNFGSRDGDAPAAMRYTEVRMDRFAEELLADLDKGTVNFGPNYDESLMQPLVLPSKFPNLLLNGSTGIAVGMATNIPPHNLTELVDGILHLIDNPEATVADLMQFIKGPDFPTYGVICGKAPIHKMYHTGRGAMRVRGRAEIQETKQGKQRILITELPYQVNKAKLVENIAHLVHSKTIEGISDLRDESNLKEPVRIVVELKKGVLGDIILNNLFKHTQLQSSFGANMLAISEGRPKTMNLKQMLLCFTDHRFEVVTRRTQFDLDKAEARAHILEGLIIALDNMDEVVRTIRAAKNRDEARINIIEIFKFTEIQAKAILEMRLYQLTGLEREKTENEYQELLKLITHLKTLLSSSTLLYDVIKEELADIKKRFGDVRRTEIVEAQEDMEMEDLIPDEPCIITISHAGYVKRVPADTYREQRRGGKGVAGMATKDEDYVEHLFTANTHDYIMFFTNSGRVYWEKVYMVPEATRTARGKAVINLLSLREDEKIAATIFVREFSEDCHLVMATQNGVVKKTNLAAFKNPRRDGIIAINIDEGDKLIEVKETNSSEHIILTTSNGKSIRFDEQQLRDQGRATRGVRGIRLAKGDAVKSMAILNDDATLLVCTENGYGKKTSFDEYRSQKRGGTGVISIKTSKRNGKVVAAHSVMEEDSLMLITANGKMIKMSIGDMRIIGRATQGVRLMNLGKDDILVAATTVEPDDEVVEEETPPEVATETPQEAAPEAEATDATTEPEGE